MFVGVSYGGDANTRIAGGKVGIQLPRSPAPTIMREICRAMLILSALS